MKITNFHDYEEKRVRAYGGIVARAKVTVTTTSWLFFKHSEVREVYLNEFATNWRWRFLDTGEYTPRHAVETLHSLYIFNKTFDASVA